MMKVVPTRLGEAYQAEIPPLLTPAEQQRHRKKQPPRSRQVWTPSRFSEDEVTEYLRCARHTDTEPALRCLYEADFNVHKASQLLHSERQKGLRKRRQRRTAIDDEAFEAAIQTHGKRFAAIKHQFPDGSTGDLIARFYEWKTSTAYKKWRERMKIKKSKEAERLRQWADQEESDTSDFHNEYCELCFTGGQLLCCDGCERAYHFSCVDPPIKDIPMGDWFCFNCASILGTSLTMRTSKENEFCEEAVVVTANGEVDHSMAQDEDGMTSDGQNEEDDADYDASANGGAAGTSTLSAASTTGTSVDEVAIKEEPMPMRSTARLYTPERHSSIRLLGNAKRTVDSDARTPTDLVETNRKRQRKVVAPRRILHTEDA